METNNALKIIFADWMSTTYIELGELHFYEGPSPGANNPATGTLLVTFSSIAMDAADANGVAYLTATLTEAALATGLIGYARFTYLTVVIDYVVSLTGGGGNVTVNAPNTVAGVDLDLTGFAYRMA